MKKLRRSTPENGDKCIFLRIEIVYQHDNTVLHYIRLKHDNQTLAILDIDPKRIRIGDGDELHISRCTHNSSGYFQDEEIFSIISTDDEEKRPKEQRTIR